MAVPTFTSITPNAGTTKGGNIVKIEGTNFRLPGPAQPLGKTTGELLISVRVLFEGVECQYAEAASDGIIYCRVPQWEGAYNGIPMALDLTIQNIDDDGIPIPGEEVIVTDAYTIERANLAEESTIQRVTRELIKLFRRHFLENTDYRSSRDYSTLLASFERQKPDLPACYLLGPRLPVNRFCYDNVDDCEEGPTLEQWDRKKPPIAVDIVHEIVVVADSAAHMTSLQQELLLFFRDVAEVADGDKIYELRMPFNGYPRVSSVPNLDDIITVRATCVIKRVHVNDSDGNIIESGWMTQETGIEFQSF